MVRIKIPENEQTGKCTVVVPGKSSPKLRYPLSKVVAGKGGVHIQLCTLPNLVKESRVKSDAAITEKFGTLMYRVGLILIMSGILIGLVFSEWTPILVVGIIFIVPEITRMLIKHHGDDQESVPDELSLLQPNQEEV